MLLQEGAGGEGQPPSPDECVPASPGQWAGGRRRIINTEGFFSWSPFAKSASSPRLALPLQQCSAAGPSPSQHGDMG